MKERQHFGYGEDYCYVHGTRFLHVVATSLEICRLMVTDRKLVKIRNYRLNPKRQHFIFKL